MTRVSCWNNSGCFAFGWYSSFKGDITFTERWNGNKWSIVKSASPPEVANTSNSNKLVDVSRAAANFCFAVGYYLTSDELAVDQNPYGLRWDGSKWELLRIALPAGRRGGAARSVSCGAVQRNELEGGPAAERRSVDGFLLALADPSR